MGWTLSPYYFVKLVEPVFQYLRSPLFSDKRSHQRCYRRKFGRRRGFRMLPFMDDILFLFSSYAAALAARDTIMAVLEKLGLSRNEKKGHWEPGRTIYHLGLDIDMNTRTNS